MALKFPLERKRSPVFGIIRRPIARVGFYSPRTRNWLEVWMIVDTGADYTILPGYLAQELGIRLAKDAKKFATSGIGGRENVWLVRDLRTRLGQWERRIPVGFLERDDVPPLMGRHQFLETFETRFRKRRDVVFLQ